jgi:hypothetical protein
MTRIIAKQFYPHHWKKMWLSISLYYRNSPLWKLSFHVNSRLAVTICCGHNVSTRWDKCAEHCDTCVHPRRHKHSGLSFLQSAAPSEKDTYQNPHQCNQGSLPQDEKIQGKEYVYAFHLIFFSNASVVGFPYLPYSKLECLPSWRPERHQTSYRILTECNIE